MEGYDALGAIMGAYPGLSIFRKFGALNSRYILFLQAQLVEKEGKLLSAIANDRNSEDNDRKSFSFNFDAMMSSKSVPPDGEDNQRELMLEIGSLLSSYYQGLSRQQWLFTLPSVHKPHLDGLRAALYRGPEEGSFLNGREWFTWVEENEHDLISLTDGTKDRDTLSTWLEWLITKFYHKRFGHQLHKRITVSGDWALRNPAVLTYYPDAYIGGVVTILTTILAPVLPTVSAMSLYFIEDQLTRLGVIVLLSLLFSTAIALVGVPRKIDSFAATAAFIAVLMVFVGGNTGCTC